MAFAETGVEIVFDALSKKSFTLLAQLMGFHSIFFNDCGRQRVKQPERKKLSGLAGVKMR
jgi:hypothetical protein